MLLIPNISDYYRIVMISPHIALVNSMACRVFRKVKLGMIREDDISLPSFSFASRHTGSFRMQGLSSNGRNSNIHIPQDASLPVEPAHSKSFSLSEMDSLYFQSCQSASKSGVGADLPQIRVTDINDGKPGIASDFDHNKPRFGESGWFV